MIFHRIVTFFIESEAVEINQANNCVKNGCITTIEKIAKSYNIFKKRNIVYIIKEETLCILSRLPLSIRSLDKISVWRSRTIVSALKQSSHYLKPKQFPRTFNTRLIVTIKLAIRIS